MDLTTRGLDGSKFYDILEQNEEAFRDDTCLETFDFSESLSGSCSDTYRKLMEFRVTCWELFSYFFTTNNTFQLSPSNSSKKVGQSATEFCDALEKNSSDDSKKEDITLLTQYKNYLICVFENIYYLDAYGRINEYEINLSYQETQLESAKSKALVKTCSHRANSKYQSDYYGNVVFEMQKCLKSHSTFFESVFRLRDEISRKY